jgi:hypothetical protein
MVFCADFRRVRLEPIDGRTLYIGNPPYVRHHDISEADKVWFAAGAASLGLRASKLAGLHMHFFLRTRQLVRPGDYGAFVTSAEWLDVNYGSILRRMLADGLGGSGLHVLAADAMPFDATTTGAITTFRVGEPRSALSMRSVASARDLGSLDGGIPVDWNMARSTNRWSVLVRGAAPRAPASGYIEVGELFRVHRGQVTGANGVWIAGSYPGRVPPGFLFPCITRAREIISGAPVLSDPRRLRSVIDLPVDLGGLEAAECAAVAAFLRWARGRGAHQSYIAAHRKAWWSVGLREAAPIVCTYMARRPPVFASNPHGVRHINIAHGLYPREPIESAALAALARFLNGHVETGDGRTYAGGLTKFEPGEIQRLHIPDPASLDAIAA